MASKSNKETSGDVGPEWLVWSNGNGWLCDGTNHRHTYTQYIGKARRFAEPDARLFCGDVTVTGLTMIIAPEVELWKVMVRTLMGKLIDENAEAQRRVATLEQKLITLANSV